MNKEEIEEQEVDVIKETEEETKEFVIPDIITTDIGFQLMFGYKSEAHEPNQYRRR